MGAYIVSFTTKVVTTITDSSVHSIASCFNIHTSRIVHKQSHLHTQYTIYTCQSLMQNMDYLIFHQRPHFLVCQTHCRMSGEKCSFVAVVVWVGCTSACYVTALAAVLPFVLSSAVFVWQNAWQEI